MAELQAPPLRPYIIMRFDLQHPEGTFEGAYRDPITAQKLYEAYTRRAQEHDSYFNAIAATFVLYSPAEMPSVD